MWLLHLSLLVESALSGCFDSYYPGTVPWITAWSYGGGSGVVGGRTFPIATGGRFGVGTVTYGVITESPRSCLLKCKNLGYDYTGVENVNVVGTENVCLCGTANQLTVSQPEPNGCITRCPDQIDRCGATYGINNIFAQPEMSVYSDPDLPKRVAVSIGCFAWPDAAPPEVARYVGGSPDYFAKAVSPAFCLGHCYDVGYNYAGLNNGGSCYCATQEELTAAGSAADCYLRCRSGVDICGGGIASGLGPASLSVYANTADSMISLEMLGCYDSRPRGDAPRTLKVQLPPIPRLQETPERCVRTCNRHGFTHAGLEYSTRCFCGSPSDVEASKYVNMDNCPQPCQGKAGDSRSCGGAIESAMTVYQNLNYTAPILTKEACILKIDILARIAIKLTVALGIPQTPESCVDSCTNNGYPFAATEATQCTCLTSGQLGQMSRVTGCTLMCLGKTESDAYKFCGGSHARGNTVSVYALAN